MKKIIFVLCALFSGVVFSQQNTAAITQVDPLQDLVNQNLSCLSKNAPKNWVFLRAIFDRSDTKQPKLAAQAYIKDQKEPVEIQVCDVNKQAELMMRFDAIVPADQKEWKHLIFSANEKSEYSVFTDIGFNRAQQNKQQ